MPTDTVHWNNEDWDSVTLEVRKGNDPTPAQNPIHATPTLSRGETHTELSDATDFWWFRTRPAGDGAYIHRPCYGNGATYEERVS